MNLLKTPVFLLLLCCLPPLAVAETVRIKHQGVTLNAELNKSDNWGEGPVVVMLHGTLAHSGMEIMTTLSGLFNDNGISTLAINLSLGLDNRPAAMYECPTPHTHKHTDAVEEIGAWMGWLKAQGAGKRILLGHSRGGNQAAWYAAEGDMSGVEKLVLIAPGGWNKDKGAGEYKKRYGKELAPILKKAHELVAAGKPKEMLQPLDFIYCEQTAASAEAVVAYYDPQKLQNTRDLLARVKVPVMVFAGSKDKVVKDVAGKMEGLVDGERIQLEVLDGAGHFFRDLYADEIVEMLLEYFET